MPVTLTQMTLNEPLSDAGYREVQNLLVEAQKELEDLQTDFEPHASQRTTLLDQISIYRIALAPHKKLPSELLSRIFLHRFAKPIKIHSKGFAALWQLCQVCVHWREVALRTPGLWTNASIVLGSEVSTENRKTLRMAETFFSRSGSSLISLRISSEEWANLDFPDQPLNPVCDLLELLAKRLKKFDIRVPGIELLVLPPSSLGVLGTPIFSVSVKSEDRYPVAMGMRRRRLRRLGATAMNQYMTPAPNPLYVPWFQLAELHLPFAVTIHSILRQCTNLVHFGISFSHRRPGRTEISQLSLKHLEKLELDFYSIEQAVWFLNPLVLPLLRDLKIHYQTGSENLMEEMTDLIHRSSNTIKRFTGTRLSDRAVHIILQKLPSLVELHIPSLDPKILGRISRGELCPCVETLEFTDSDYMDEVMEMLQCRSIRGDGKVFNTIQNIVLNRQEFEMLTEKEDILQKCQELGVNIRLKAYVDDDEDEKEVVEDEEIGQ